MLVIKNKLDAITKLKSLFQKSSFLNSGLLVLAFMILGKIFSFFWKMLVLRHNVQILGEIEVILTTLGVATTLTTLALPAALTRFALKEKRQATSYLLTSLSFSAIAFLIVSLLVLLSSSKILTLESEVKNLVSLFLLAILASATQENSLAYLNSQKKFLLYGLGKHFLVPTIKIVLLGSILLGFLNKGLIISHVLWSTILATLVISLLTFKNISFKKLIPLKKKQKKRFFSYSTFLSASFLSFILYGAADIYFLQFFFGARTVGEFVGLITIVNILDLILLPFLQIFQAHLADKKANHKIKFTQNIFISLLIIGLAAGLIIASTGNKILAFVSNNTLNFPLWLIFLFSVWKTIHFSFVLLPRNYLDFFGKEKYTAKTMLISLILKVAIGSILIPTQKITGLLLTNILVDIFHTWFLFRKFPANFFKTIPESVLLYFPKNDS